MPESMKGTHLSLDDFISYKNVSHTQQAFVANISSIVEPNTFSQAKQDP